MAAQVQVFGPCNVYIDDVHLGLTRNGVEFTDEGFFLDVPGDENGGDEGPPIDVQYLGIIARLRMEFTKWNGTVGDTVAARVKGATVGTVDSQNNPSGTLMFTDGNYFVVKLIPTNTSATTPQNASIQYNVCFPRQAIEINKGTKYSTFVIEFECHKDSSGVVYQAI
jgi:hypothetical protein